MKMTRTSMSIVTIMIIIALSYSYSSLRIHESKQVACSDIMLNGALNRALIDIYTNYAKYNRVMIRISRRQPPEILSIDITIKYGLESHSITTIPTEELCDNDYVYYVVHRISSKYNHIDVLSTCIFNKNIEYNICIASDCDIAAGHIVSALYHVVIAIALLGSIYIVRLLFQ